MENRLPVPSSGMISWGVTRSEVWTCPGGPGRWQTLVSPCLASPVTFRMRPSSSKRLFWMSSAVQGLVPCCSPPVVLRLSHGHGKVLVETGSENPALVGSELAGTPALGAQSNLKALVLVGCETGVTLSCSSWTGFSGCRGKIPPSRRRAVHTDDQLRLSADTVPQGQDCFPARSLSPWMGNALHRSDWLQSISPCAARAKPGSFMDLEEKLWGWACTEVGSSHPRENDAYKQRMLKTLLHNRFYHVEELKHNSVSATLLCLFLSA